MHQNNTPQSASITLASDRETPPDLRLLHYNDVYHIESGSAEPAGGISRFQTVVNEYRSSPRFEGQASLITFFSGDAFNPSLESSVTKGKHMVPILNAIGTDVACVGNHDLDFGITQFRHLRSLCRFPWLLANVLDPALGEEVALADCEKTKILTSSTGIKIGVIGLAEREWLDTVNSLPPDLVYKSASTTAQELVPGLRKEGCELIVAVTHMREPNDVKLAEKTPPGLIDLILGGHDHFYSCQRVNSTYILRSGTDFKQLSYIEGWKKDGGGWDFAITRRDIIRSTPEDPPTVELVNKLTYSLTTKLEKPIGYTAAPLDGRFTTVRTRESNLGNFVCDLMRYYYRTECAIMAAGTIRGDQVYSPGLLRLKDIMNCFPFEDPVVVLKVTGKALSEALENSVSLVPALEGRFPQVSNIIFEYDAKLSPGSRVQWVKVNGEKLDQEREYILATRGYMARGKDGFESLLAQSEGGKAEEIVSEENGVLISTILRQYFLSLKVVGTWSKKNPHLSRHWGGVQKGLQEHGTIIEAKSTEKSKNTVTKDLENTAPEYSRNGSLKTSNGPIRHQAPLPSRPQTNSNFGNTERVPTDPKAEQGLVDPDIDADSDSDIADTDNLSSTPFSAHPLLSNTAPPTSIPAYLSEESGEHLFRLARLYAKRWMRLAGVKAESVAMVDESTEDALPSWTKGIAPKLEGRIRIIGGER
ncbi:hypothetical protein EPUS_01707 [Endocarpon pusillum Z07020]|uniref:Uncharacterized protein n=1 Tax=Endocarpon pusillum (strain Z07020 / HMAS-L-300199) TaxID=1263415 RepID=U1G3B9_ENDPU|nr:uncharacterized protein EPUS_01707 [Endocarpon pusillum Z07020]ERF71792.1 hypothetical protein EPUS_01707 [Endocarpon pusillum Z07020]